MAEPIHTQGPMPRWLRSAFGMLHTPKTLTPNKGMTPPPNTAPAPTTAPGRMPKPAMMPALDLDSPNNIMTEVDRMVRGD